jgi:hypothetical protein
MNYFRPDANAVGTDAELRYLTGPGGQRPPRPGNAAANHVAGIVSAVLAGRWKEFVAIATERVAWLEADTLLASGEASDKPSNRVKLLSALAVARWLLGKPDAAAAWSAAALNQGQALKETGVYAAGEESTFGLDDLMGYFLSANQFREAVEAYRGAFSEKHPTPTNCRNPRDWACVAATQALESRWSAQVVYEAGRRMLRRHLDDPWLGRGQAVRGAMWVALVHTPANPGLCPERILMQAYEDLPCGWPPELRRWRIATD